MKQLTGRSSCVSTLVTIRGFSEIFDLGHHNAAAWTGALTHVLDGCDQNPGLKCEWSVESSEAQTYFSG